MLVSSVDTLWMGLHWSWMMSMHSVPSEYTAHQGAGGARSAVHGHLGAAGAPHAPFGWNTSLVKRTRGGFSG